MIKVNLTEKDWAGKLADLEERGFKTLEAIAAELNTDWGQILGYSVSAGVFTRYRDVLPNKQGLPAELKALGTEKTTGFEKTEAEKLIHYYQTEVAPHLPGAKETQKAPTLKPWAEHLAKAKAEGFRTIEEIAAEVGLSWSQLLSWVDQAGLAKKMIDLSPRIPKLPEDRRDLKKQERCGFWKEDAATLVKFVNDLQAAAEERLTKEAEESAASAQEAYDQHQKEKAEKAAELEARQQTAREERISNRRQADKERQVRLVRERLIIQRAHDVDAAKQDVWKAEAQLKLAEAQLASLANRDAREKFLASRQGEQNYEYASTNRNIGRGWAQGIVDRYQGNLNDARQVLENVDAGGDYPWDEESLRNIDQWINAHGLPGETVAAIKQEVYSEFDERQERILDACRTYYGELNLKAFRKKGRSANTRESLMLRTERLK